MGFSLDTFFNNVTGWFNKYIAEPIGDIWNNFSGAAKSQEFNADQAQKQRQWEQDMSSSAYQRSMEDLKAAGLNPSLIYGTGGEASTPSGSAASSSTPTNPLIGNIAGMLNSMANLMNSSTRQLANERYSKHLDYREREEIQETTNRIYDNAGNLISRLVTDTARYKK